MAVAGQAGATARFFREANVSPDTFSDIVADCANINSRISKLAAKIFNATQQHFPEVQALLDAAAETAKCVMELLLVMEFADASGGISWSVARASIAAHAPPAGGVPHAGGGPPPPPYAGMDVA